MIDLSKARIGDQFLTRNGMVVKLIHCQNRVYEGSNGNPFYYVSEFIFVWYMTPEHPKFITVSKNGLEWSPFKGKWDIIRKISDAESPISIF